MYKKGFTLAEVLITLMIIGVIASLVIPNIVSDTKDAEFNVGLKKIYADLNQAISLIQINNGGSVPVGNPAYTFNWQPLRDEFCNVMTCIKKDTENNVFAGKIYKYYKSNTNISSSTFDNSSNNSAVLNNGVILGFSSNDNCNYWGVNMCGSVRVDLNGPKGPNMLGKDTYLFYIVRPNGTGNYSILPVGTSNDTYVSQPPPGCKANSIDWKTSEGCTAVRLTNPDALP